MFLDVAEDRAARRKGMSMADWEGELDRFLVFNDRPVLRNAGNISHDRMERLTSERYELFDAKRKDDELEASERDFEEDLKRIEKTVTEFAAVKKRK